MKPVPSKSARDAEAIAGDRERWQLDEVHTGLTELNEGRGVPHPAVVKWLRSWGKKPERKRLAGDHRLVAVRHVSIRGRNGEGACELLHVWFVRDAEP